MDLSRIEPLIHVIRGQRVMLDEDLARVYGVPIKRLNQQVRRNLPRFPEDFMFRMTAEESHRLRSQIVTLENAVHGKHRKYWPLAFTEQGVAMLSGVLHSGRAVEVNVALAALDLEQGEQAAQIHLLFAELRRLSGWGEKARRRRQRAAEAKAARPRIRSTPSERGPSIT